MDIRDHYLRDYAAYREAGFEILGVARNTDEDLRGNLPDLGIVWPVVADRPKGVLPDVIASTLIRHSI